VFAVLQQLIWGLATGRFPPLTFTVMVLQSSKLNALTSPPTLPPLTTASNGLLQVLSFL
jgi:hypothetical protein